MCPGRPVSGVDHVPQRALPGTRARILVIWSRGKVDLALNNSYELSLVSDRNQESKELVRLRLKVLMIMVTPINRLID